MELTEADYHMIWWTRYLLIEATCRPLNLKNRLSPTMWSLQLIIVIFMVAIWLPCSFSSSIKRYFKTQSLCHFLSPKSQRPHFVCPFYWFWFFWYNNRAASDECSIWLRFLCCLHYLRWYGYSFVFCFNAISLIMWFYIRKMFLICYWLF